MEAEIELQQQAVAAVPSDGTGNSPLFRRTLIILNFTMLVLGTCCTPLLLRFYFLHGGRSQWLSSWLQNAGFFIVLIPLTMSYYHRRRVRNSNTRTFFMTSRLFLACAVLGLLMGVFSFLYAYSVSYLPVSTTTLLSSTTLGFTALFAFLLVRQSFTAYSVNSIVLLTVGAVVLGIHSDTDRPNGEKKSLYYLGFAMMLGASALYGLVNPLIELTYAKAKQAVRYTLVMEMQLVMGLFSTLVCTVAMVVSKEFQVIQKEAEEFTSGTTSYYMVLVWSAISCQLFGLGLVGAIYYSSALLISIVVSVLNPVTQVLAVIFFHESFNGGKGVALALSVWGFVSYFYGENKGIKKKEKAGLEAKPHVPSSSS